MLSRWRSNWQSACLAARVPGSTPSTVKRKKKENLIKVPSVPWEMLWVTMSSNQRAQRAFPPGPRFSQSPAWAPFLCLNSRSEWFPFPSLQGFSVATWNYSSWSTSPVPSRNKLRVEKTLPHFHPEHMHMNSEVLAPTHRCL